MMRVLLWHEMSGLHTELARGLRALGVDVKVATLAGGHRGFVSDYDLGREGSDLYARMTRVARQFYSLKSFRQFDIVQTISPEPYVSYTSHLIERLFPSDSQRFVYIAAGSDAVYTTHVRELDYYPPHAIFEQPKKYKTLKRMLQRTAAIVPVCWEYDYCMKRAGFSPHMPIPFPIAIDSAAAKPRPHNKKLLVYHPLNRKMSQVATFDFKGTAVISQAFDVLRKRFGRYVDFDIKGGMSLDEYKVYSSNVDILVDQIYSYSYGMSAAYAMAAGQVVVSGLHPRGVQDLPRWSFWSECPIQQAPQTIEKLIELIESLLDDRVRLDLLREQSTYFARTYHDARAVAQRYITMYEGL